MKKGIHIINPKQQERIYHHTSFYSICDMSSSRKSEIQHDLPKIIFLTNSGKKSLTMFISSCLTTVQLNFKNREIKKIKSYTSGGIRTRNP